MSRFKPTGFTGTGGTHRSPAPQQWPSPFPAQPAAPAGLPTGILLKPGRTTAGMLVVAFFLFVVISRLPEVMINVLGSSLRIALFTSVLGGLICLFSGSLPETLSNRGTLGLLVFTGWWIVCIPFSVWPGGSVGLMRSKWVFDILGFLIVASVPRTMKGLDLYGGAMAWAVIFVNMVLLKYGVQEQDRGSLEFASSLGNPNIAALQLLLGLPFLIYWTRTRGFFSFRGLLGFGSAGLAAYLIVMRTGSRSGLLILFVVVIRLIWSTKMHVRLTLLIGLVIGIAAVIPFIPSYLLYRYGTMVKSSANDSSEAVKSAHEREALLKRSIELTFEHPLFGVGAGQFQVAAAALSEMEGEKAIWLETHNMYTQISSETGFPGVMIYVSMIFLSLAPVWKDLRAAKRAKVFQPRHEFERALLLAAFGLLINSAFTSVAYDYYWPVICAMGVACQRVIGLEKAANAALATEPNAAVPAVRGRLTPRLA